MEKRVKRTVFSLAVSSFEGSGSPSEDFIQNQRSLDQVKTTKSIKDSIDEINRNLYPDAVTTISDGGTKKLINNNTIDEDGNICYCHTQCCNKKETPEPSNENTLIAR